MKQQKELKTTKYRTLDCKTTENIKIVNKKFVSGNFFALKNVSVIRFVIVQCI